MGKLHVNTIGGRVLAAGGRGTDGTRRRRGQGAQRGRVARRGRGTGGRVGKRHDSDGMRGRSFSLFRFWTLMAQGGGVSAQANEAFQAFCRARSAGPHGVTGAPPDLESRNGKVETKDPLSPIPGIAHRPVPPRFKPMSSPIPSCAPAVAPDAQAPARDDLSPRTSRPAAAPDATAATHPFAPCNPHQPARGDLLPRTNRPAAAHPPPRASARSSRRRRDRWHA